MKRKALGKGLDALLPQSSGLAALVQLDIETIRPNPRQPRVRFEGKSLAELVASVKEKGILQPIVVRQSLDGYQIIAGERRWRAAQQAGLQKVPCIVHNVSDQEMVELALVENVQRDDLSPVEEAQAYQLMIDEFSLKQDEIARRVGRSRSAVANTLRLLQLPESIQAMVISGDLSMGHARALLPLPRKQQLVLARTVTSRGLSVRDVERRVKHLLSRPPATPSGPRRDPNLIAAEKQLEDRWRTRVQIKQKGASGQVVIHFHSTEELERLFEELLG